MSSKSKKNTVIIKAALIAAFALLLVISQESNFTAQEESFSKTLYPVLEKAACRSCHYTDGVASATRLQFPETEAKPERVTADRHHDYTHADGRAPGADGAAGQRILRDICRWHAEEFAFLLARLKSVPEGDGTLLDHCCLVYVHEHAEANPHKNHGLGLMVAGHAGRLASGRHSRMTGTIGDLYLTLAADITGAGLSKFPTATKKLSALLT